MTSKSHTTTLPRKDEAEVREIRVIHSLLLVLIPAAAVLKIWLVLRLNVNWDEFFYLAQVHSYARGDELATLQTFHVHLFHWLTLLPGDEIAQITAARLIMVALSLASAALFFSIVRRFVSDTAALAAVLIFLTFSQILDHGASFRADPLCAFLFLCALYAHVIAANRTWCHLLAGALMGLAVLISIKSAFYGLFWAVLLLTALADRPKTTIRQAALILAGMAVTIAALYGFHAAMIASPEPVQAAQHADRAVTSAIAAIAQKVIGQAGFFPRFPSFLHSLLANPIAWLSLAAGGVMGLLTVCRAQPNPPARLALASLAIMATLLFYRNAFPYYYVFLMPAGLFAVAYAFDALFRRAEDTTRPSMLARIAALIVVLMTLGNLAIFVGQNWQDRRVGQGEIIELVHELFPDPVPYIDRSSMIASFPKVGFFMSSWGMEGYWARGRPVMEALIRERQPKFLIANSCALELSRQATDEAYPCYLPLMDDDLAALRANFVHKWGALYLAGKAFTMLLPGEAEIFEILIAGTYTLEAGAPVAIDGKVYRPGDRVQLDQGLHRIAALHRATGAVLRFGDDPARQDRPPSDQLIYYGL